jgi:hypothetical protein
MSTARRHHPLPPPQRGGEQTADTVRSVEEGNERGTLPSSLRRGQGVVEPCYPVFARRRK